MSEGRWVQHASGELYAIGSTNYAGIRYPREPRGDYEIGVRASDRADVTRAQLPGDLSLDEVKAITLTLLGACHE
jgi:hypothetical protein